MKRFFLVGCARSGTTLLQSLLASHPEVISFPESNFFNHLFPHSEPKRKRLGIISRRAKPTLSSFLQESGYKSDRLSPFALFPRQLTAYFSNTLDQIATQQNKTIWIEKTPSHLYHLDYIARHIDRPRFIHIIRAGKDTVASLYDVRQKYPKQWANEPPSIELSIERWIKDVSISLQYADAPNHFLLSYEDLVARPQTALENLCQFMDLSFLPTMLSGYTAIAHQVCLAREPWKAGVTSSIRSANSTKFYSLFSSQQQAYISQRLSAIDLTMHLGRET